MLASARSSLRLAVLVLLTTLAACTLSRRAQARPPSSTPVRYRLELPDPHRQYVHVRMEVDGARGAASRVAMPAWTPGSYLVRDHGRHVYDLRAEDRRGRRLEVERLDKQTWQVQNGGRPFTVHYRVFAADASVRSSHVDDRHASLVGTSMFLYVVDELERPAQVDIALPEGWSAHCALPSTGGAGTISLSATNYDALVDAPIELGTPQVERFTENGATFEYVLTGAEDTAIDLPRLVADARRVVRAQGELMGGFPFSRYVFLLRVSEDGGGGLEHANSTSMMMRRSAFDRDEGYARAARLVAHEFFHLWNVKRIHDRVLGPFDYTKENHSRLLWLHEGLTETMEGHSLLRAGLVEPEDYVRGLGRRFSKYSLAPGRNHDSIANLSFEAWTKAYKPAPNHPNVAISYYEKGDFIGIALDLELRLRSASHGLEGSLPGLFRRLMASHGIRNRGITAQDVVAAASEEAGEDMSEFFTRYVEGTEELPLPDLMPRVGVKVDVEASWLDAGGKPRATLTPAQRRERIFTGLQLTSEAAIRNIVPGSPADRAGLMRDDELLAVGDLRVRNRGEAQTRLADHEPGQTVRLTLFRGGRLEQRDLTVEQNPARHYRFSMLPEAELSPEVLALRTAWLGGQPGGD